MAYLYAYGPGEEHPTPRPGDFVLTRGSGLFSKLIRIGQMVRIHGRDVKYTTINHAALVIDTKGNVIEANGKTVARAHISQWKETDYVYVKVNADEHDRLQAVEFALAQEGDTYSWVGIVSIALTMLTGAKLNFSMDDQWFCSELVAEALERTGKIFPRKTSHIAPADLAKIYGAVL